jgi:hypothetical protein
MGTIFQILVLKNSFHWTKSNFDFQNKTNYWAMKIMVKYWEVFIHLECYYNNKDIA